MSLICDDDDPRCVAAVVIAICVIIAFLLWRTYG